MILELIGAIVTSGRKPRASGDDPVLVSSSWEQFK